MKVNCNVQGAYMNLRYKILDIGEERFILDMGGSSFWKILFPFFYWMLPVNVYKVSDDELIEQIVSPYIEQKSIGWKSLLGGVIALGLGNLLRPFVDYLNVEITPLMSVIIIAIICMIIISFFFYLNILCGKKLRKQVNLDELPQKKLWIRPESTNHFLHVIFTYLLFLGLSVLFLGGSIQMPNGFMFFAGTMVLFLALAVSMLTIRVGDTTVRFKGK